MYIHIYIYIYIYIYTHLYIYIYKTHEAARMIAQGPQAIRTPINVLDERCEDNN